jgi:diadenosine tetraphosphatase ApaH/serine/threonine PP2A family protein phosphatase
VVAFTNGQDSYSVIESDRLQALVDRSDAVLHAVLWARPSAGAQPDGGVIMFGNADGASRHREFAEFPDRRWEGRSKR